MRSQEQILEHLALVCRPGIFSVFLVARWEGGWNLRQGFYESVLESSSPGRYRLFSLPGCRTSSLLKNPARAFQKPIPIRAHECGNKISFCNFCKGYFTIHSLRIICPIIVRCRFRKAMVSLQEMPVYNPSPPNSR
jgi:hypothetical protein